MDTARRRALNASVAALCIEAGYLSSDRGAIELLTQILQSYICEIGRTSRAYSDSAHRSDPSVCDIELALIDLGAKYSKLDDYSRRPHRRHVPRQVRNYPHPQNKLLQVGTKKQRPPHIPPHLPPFPDNHTYVKTATYQLPHMDYKTIREKLAEQRSQSRQCFSKYLAKTCPSASIAGEIDTNGLYTVLLPQEPTKPVFVSALMPSEADSIEMTNSKENESNAFDVSSLSDQSLNESKEEKSLTNELYQNPFLKAVKKSTN